MEDVVASILAQLKNKAEEQGIPLQQLLNLFCQEEFIRRLSNFADIVVANDRNSYVMKDK